MLLPGFVNIIVLQYTQEHSLVYDNTYYITLVSYVRSKTSPWTQNVTLWTGSEFRI